MHKLFSFGASLSTILFVLILVGCSKDSSTPVSPSTSVTQPRGTISGLVRNWVTNEPVPNAEISIAYNGTVQKTFSDSSGEFSFADVPAGEYFNSNTNGRSVFSGTYHLTISLVKYNVTQTDPNKKYRDYYYEDCVLTFTSLGNGDSASVNGMVADVQLNISYLNTTIKGQVVDMNMRPVSNAVVTLWDESINPGVVLKQTSTASDGTYQFTGVDNGLAVEIMAVSQDGSLQGKLQNTWYLPPNLTIDSLRSGVSAERIMVSPVDDTPPYVIGITPENNSDVSASTLSIVYTFSEPIKQNAYTRTDLPLGSNTMLDDMVLNFNGMKKTTGTVGFTAQWNSTFSQLTITPQGIVGSAKYSFDMTAVFQSGKLTDAALNPVVNNVNIIGDFEPLNFTTNGGSPVPAVPVVSRQLVPGYFAKLDYTGGAIELQWNYDPNARSYNIYKSVNGSPFQLDQKDIYAIQYSENTGSLVQPLNALNPYSAGSVSYEVRAVSKDLVETAASNVITITDEVSPQLTGATVAPAAGTYNYIYTLHFSEPLNISKAENLSSYSFSNTNGVTFTKTAAYYIGYDNISNSYLVKLAVTTSANPVPGYVLTVIGVTDLAGNSMDDTANSATF
jgi:hypothetical protein